MCVCAQNRIWIESGLNWIRYAWRVCAILFWFDIKKEIQIFSQFCHGWCLFCCMYVCVCILGVQMWHTWLFIYAHKCIGVACWGWSKYTRRYTFARNRRKIRKMNVGYHICLFCCCSPIGGTIVINVFVIQMRVLLLFELITLPNNIMSE